MKIVLEHLQKKGVDENYVIHVCHGGDLKAAEAVAANHMGMKVCGISCITNMGCGMLDQPLSHEEVQETADRVAVDFKRLITACIINIYNEMKEV